MVVREGKADDRPLHLKLLDAELIKRLWKELAQNPSRLKTEANEFWGRLEASETFREIVEAPDGPELAFQIGCFLIEEWALIVRERAGLEGLAPETDGWDLPDLTSEEQRRNLIGELETNKAALKRSIEVLEESPDLPVEVEEEYEDDPGSAPASVAATVERLQWELALVTAKLWRVRVPSLVRRPGRPTLLGTILAEACVELLPEETWRTNRSRIEVAAELCEEVLGVQVSRARLIERLE